MEQKANIASVVLIVALIASYFFFQNKIETLESQLSSIDAGAEVVESPTYVSSDSSTLQEQLDDLSEQLITTRSELQSIQQKLIFSTSKIQVLEDEIVQMTDVRPKLESVKKLLLETKGEVKTEKQVSQVSQAKYDKLKTALHYQNVKVAIRNTERIRNLRNTISAASITAAAVPLLSIATLIKYTNNEVGNYCNDIEDIITLEKKAFGESKSITGEILERFESLCR